MNEAIFNSNELDMVYQYAAADKAATLAGLKEIVPVIKDTMTREIVENTISKLTMIPEPECSLFIADVQAYFLKKRDDAISAKQQLAEEKTKMPWQ